MNPLHLFIALIALFPGVAIAQTPFSHDPYLGGANNRSTVLLVVPPQPTWQSKQLVDGFAKDPQLSAVKSRFKLQTLTTSDALYRERYAGVLPEFEAPIVAVCDPLARVFYKASRTTLPSSNATLASKIVDAIPQLKQAAPQEFEGYGADCPDGNCPDQPYCPDGNCPLPNNPSVGPIPDSPTQLGLGEWIAIALGAVVALVTVAVFAIFGLLLVKYLVRK